MNLGFRPAALAGIPFGMSRRHFLSHLAGAAALAGPATSFTN